MKRKLPDDAFDYYLALGAGRSYRAVAEKYGVTKVAVTNLAKRDNWQARLAEIEAKARQRGDERAAESMEAIRERQLKAARVIQGKGLEALRNMTLDTAMDAVRAIDIGLKQERLLMGEPSERTAVSVEDVIRREYDRWMQRDGEDDALDSDDDDDDDEGEGEGEQTHGMGVAS